MNLKETFKQAFDSLWANKLRSSLTLLALVVGVFSVIVSTTAVAVLDNYFQNTMSLMGGDVINVSRNPSIQIGNDNRSDRNRKKVSFTNFEELQQRLRLAGNVSPNELFDRTNVTYGDEEPDPTVRVTGSNQYYLDNNAYILSDGRNFSAEDIQYARKVAIVGSEIWEELFINEY